MNYLLRFAVSGFLGLLPSETYLQVLFLAFMWCRALESTLSRRGLWSESESYGFRHEETSELKYVG